MEIVLKKATAKTKIIHQANAVI